MERFWAKVKKGKADECWPWQGARNGDGYGYVKINGKLVAAHRLAFQLTNGDIGPGKSVCHDCDNPPCCNPAHLFSGTKSDNMRDAGKKGRLRQQHGRPTTPRPLRQRPRPGEGIAAFLARTGLTVDQLS